MYIKSKSCKRSKYTVELRERRKVFSFYCYLRSFGRERKENEKRCKDVDLNLYKIYFMAKKRNNRKRNENEEKLLGRIISI